MGLFVVSPSVLVFFGMQEQMRETIKGPILSRKRLNEELSPAKFLTSADTKGYRFRVKILENRSQPLAEVCGYLITDDSASAKKARSERLCPYGNTVPRCTKVNKENPLAVCSMYTGHSPVIICPVRFREAGIVYQHAANFFFPENSKIVALREISLEDADGKEAGNIDVILAAVNENDQIIDFGSLEIQAVYISGNINNPFKAFIANPNAGPSFHWVGQEKYPRPDWLSSTRKRLAPQLLYKGGILKTWKKKSAIALDKHLFATMPKLPEVDKAKADMAWLLYDLIQNEEGRYNLQLVKTVYTEFEPTLKILTEAPPGDVNSFLKQLEITRARRAKTLKKKNDKRNLNT